MHHPRGFRLAKIAHIHLAAELHGTDYHFTYNESSISQLPLFHSSSSFSRRGVNAGSSMFNGGHLLDCHAHQSVLNTVTPRKLQDPIGSAPAGGICSERLQRGAGALSIGSCRFWEGLIRRLGKQQGTREMIAALKLYRLHPVGSCM